MPKSKPTQVIVHRIELQEKERDMLEAYVGGSVVKNVTGPVIIAAGVGSAAYIGYKTAKAVAGWTEDIMDDLGELADGVMEPVLGKKEYEDKETGKTYKNPFAGIPVVGSLFGAGINIGIATNPFK